jgi:hypothetical protein
LPSYAGARAPRGGITGQGVVLTDVQSFLDCQENISLSLSAVNFQNAGAAHPLQNVVYIILKFKWNSGRGGRCVAGWFSVRGLFAMQCAARGLVAFARCAALHRMRCNALRCAARCVACLRCNALRAGCIRAVQAAPCF